MKCKKCGTNMVKRPDGEHIYYFACPKCGKEVGRKQK